MRQTVEAHLPSWDRPGRVSILSQHLDSLRERVRRAAQADLLLGMRTDAGIMPIGDAGKLDRADAELLARRLVALNLCSP